MNLCLQLILVYINSLYSIVSFFGSYTLCISLSGVYIFRRGIQIISEISWHEGWDVYLVLCSNHLMAWALHKLSPSKPCTHILTERPHCCAWLCRSCIWNGGLYTAFSYLDRSGPCAGFCGFFWVFFKRCAAPYLSLLHAPICVPWCFLFLFVCWLIFHLTHLPSLLCLLMFFHLYTSTLICAEAVSTMVWRNEWGGLAWSELQTGAMFSCLFD